MKTLKALVLVIALASGSTGCAAASQWWQNFQKDPVGQLQSFTQTVLTILQDVAVAWQFIQPFIPMASLPTAQAQYMGAVANVTKGLGVMQDAVAAAAAAQAPVPDLSAVVTSVSDGVNQLVALVDQYKANGIPTSATLVPPGLEDARARAAHLKSYKISQ